MLDFLTHPLVVVALIPPTWWATRIVSLCLHELAHAAAGWLGGIGIKEIRIGHGPKFACYQFGNTSLRIGRTLRGGMVVPYPAFHFSKPAELIFIAAGPASDVMVATSAGWIYASGLLPSSLDWLPVSVLATQLHKLYHSVVPRDVHLSDGYGPNDAKLFLATLRRPASGLDPFWQTYLARLKHYWNGQAPEPVLSRQSERLADILYNPDIQENESFPTRSQIESISRELNANPHPAEAVFVLDHLVTHVLYSGRDDLMPQLDSWSSRALHLRPDLATLRGSRGAVFVQLGRHDEALAELAEADYSNSFNIVLNRLFVAQALYGKSRREEALDTFCSALRCYDAEGWLRQGEPWQLLERTAQMIGAEIPPREAEQTDAEPSRLRMLQT